MKAPSRIAAHAPARGLYLITPDEADTPRLLARADDALHGPVRFLQYRNKQADAALRLAQASRLCELCAERGVLFIINDDAALAAEVHADGVHLGRSDHEIHAARAMLGDGSIIGASCYADIERAENAAAQGADYLAFGAMFASPTKPLAPTAPLGLFQHAAHLGAPLVAIGGITADNALPLWRAGARYLAVISAVFTAPSPRAAVRAFQQQLQIFEDEYDSRDDDRDDENR